mgnify:CR=1 FL=1
MCQSAILWTGIGTVIFGTSIRTLRGMGWPQIDISAEEVVRRFPSRHCTVKGGVLEQQCNAVFESAMLGKKTGKVDDSPASNWRANSRY